MKICVLGHSGMLGHMIHRYLVLQKCEVAIITKRWSADYQEILAASNFDYVINCVAITPQKFHEGDKSYAINHELPIWLDENLDCRIIHAGTDPAARGDYAITKNLANDYIENKSKNTKIIETSIIGPELQRKLYLFEWFRNSSVHVKGYNNVSWNGVTTLEWSKICRELIGRWDDFPSVVKPFTDTITKYELLLTIREVFQMECHIECVNADEEIFCTKGNMHTKSISEQLIELKAFYY